MDFLSNAKTRGRTASNSKSYNGLGSDNGSSIGRAGVLGAAFNLINSIVGAGLVGLPSSFAACGFHTGIAMLVLVALFSHLALQLLVFSALASRDPQISYENLAEFVGGERLRIVVTTFMFIFSFMAQCVYLCIISDTLDNILRHSYYDESIPSSNFEVQVPVFEKNLIFLFICTFILLPLCLLRDMSSLKYTSFLSMIADIFLVFIVAFHGPSESRKSYPNIERDFTPIKSTCFAGIGTMSFAFVSQHSCFMIYSTIKDANAEKWEQVSKLGIGTSFVISLAMSIGGYMSFFDESEGDILNNFSPHDPLINVARILLALTMVFIYPIDLFVSRQALQDLFKAHDSHVSYTLYLGIGSMIIQRFVPDLKILLEIAGNLSGSSLGYILPAIFYFKIRECINDRKITPTYIGAVSMLVFGVVNMICEFSLFD